jgi:amidase
MKKLSFFLVTLVLFACQTREPIIPFVSYDETAELEKQQDHEVRRMQFKLIQSKYLDMNVVFEPFEKELSRFSEKDYLNIEPYIYEQDIPAIQNAVRRGILSYEKIVLYYLYRIRKYESNNELYLNGVIALNPNVIAQAKEADKKIESIDTLSLYGLPVLLKDNINTQEMPTTAGSFSLMDNVNTTNAFIVDRLIENGALILGKVNLSEWAYYFCSGCPLGYSAVGGQTLNPYGRKVFETGGSSSGSGVTIAANYGVAAVGTETSGSILSPSGKNSVVGLKPTIGLLSRTGIVPISSTLDTPGPMTKFVIDNAIMLQALSGKDSADPASEGSPENRNYLEGLTTASLKGKRFGVMSSLMKDSVYDRAVKQLERAGATLVVYDAPEVGLNGFRTLLNIDMKYDLPAYLNTLADDDVTVSTIADVIALNKQDTLKRAPYGQALFEGIVRDSTTLEELELVKDSLMAAGKRFFAEPLEVAQVDAVLSINNYHAGYAAVAKYPCLTVPMGYTKEGEPKNLTFIAQPYEEDKLLQMGYAFEQLTKARRAPKGYHTEILNN